MFNIFSSTPRAIRRFKVKPGRLKELNEYKLKLVEEVKSLKKEKRNLTKKVKENKIDTEKFEELSVAVPQLEADKSQLEKEIARLFKAKELILNIKALEKDLCILKEQFNDAEKDKSNLKDEVSNLKEEKALLLNEIDNLNAQKESVIQSDKEQMLSIEYVDTLNNGLEFEKYFASLLDKLGFYDIRVTSSSGDFGIDVLAYNDDILYGFQCKLYSSTVGNSAIQEAYSGKNHYGCNVVVVVTNNYFTEQAIEQAKETKVLLWNRDTLINKIKEAKKYNFTIKI